MGRNVRTGSIPVSSTLSSVHSFLCARFFLFPTSYTRLLCVRLLVHGFFVCGFFCTASLCGFWSVSASRLFPMMLCGTSAHPGRDTAGRSADRQDCEQVSSSRGAIGKKLLAWSLYEPPSGKTYWQKRTKMPILCSGKRGLAPGREVIGIGKRNRCLPANHRARFQNAKA